MNNELLQIKNLHVWYKTYRGSAKVVNGVDLHVNKSEKIAIVGESGSGKTTMMKTVLRLMDKINAFTPEGEILYNGKDILKMDRTDLLNIRRKEISMISQSPMAALNPVFTVGEQIMDIIKYSGRFNQNDKEEMQKAAVDAITSVMISDPERIMKSYPHQLSGGMRQRICIASSIVTPRQLLIADEPGTALDVTVQEQIHSILKYLVDVENRSLIMITHSLGVARELVDRIYIMYAGEIAEECKTEHLFKNPLHPYTKGLLDCVPRLKGGGLSEGIYGYVPDYVAPPKGCRFANRCKHRMDICTREDPKLLPHGEDHSVACFLYI